ncbi:YhcN/YlaJ family sporulation lipoprotein [Tenuibacillus multivorans]|uniref:Sporulation lipoprotein YhcN/YlaJ (Spore_YhcN_YlaJ) n=1 Tax=Tenuibacillus multivorans TaxID=237069 RepID=A0A1G9ZLZ2_9BACI|nr:YhcN/YlaJ family sporulation lipoprotein [Tenuibacillus multivorans]GEL77467.1 hypothetical protein TMU01_17020 [Tenuibacillus multivorans]SDN21646.1 Sporulation lipoprotein YhcN/YlaJ (Spore_YhcN_YlaJ) [Tenuibacillus multivorans]
MFKKIILFFSIIFLSACTFVNPDRQKESISDGEQTTEIQWNQEQQTTDEERIRYNAYPNPYEYYEQRETEESLGNTDNRDNIRTEEFRRENELNRQIYYELRNMREIREAGVSVQQDQIYVAINLASRADRDEVVEKVEEVVQNITDRTDITVYVDMEFHNRIENRKKD